MPERPELNRSLDSVTFKSYYYLKDELMKFCRKEGLQISGGKAELAERIAHYLDTGEKLSGRIKAKAKASVNTDELTEDILIENNFVCSEKHRTFFRQKIGRSFSFTVPFQDWLKANAGKSYGEAIEVWRKLAAEKKKVKTEIPGQFEYNTYIRDFFADNEGKSLNDAIKCWKYKKSLKGHNKYERADLAALELSY